MYKIIVSGPSKNSDFVPIKIVKNSKKIPKNIKFGLQAHFNMEIMLSGSDWLFELWKRKYNTWDIMRHLNPSLGENLGPTFYKFRACSFVTGLHGMGFDGNGNPLLKKWEPMGTETHGINYRNVLKWVFGCSVELVVGNLDLF